MSHLLISSARRRLITSNKQNNKCLEIKPSSEGFFMYRKYGIPQGARDGDAVMYRKYGIPQGARDGDAVMSMVYGQILAPR